MRYGRSLHAQVRPTIDTAIYADKDVLGGLQEIPIRGSGAGSGVLEHVTVVDLIGQMPELTILFFASEPEGTYDNNGAAAPAAADYAKIIGSVRVVDANWKQLVTGGVAVATVDCELALKAAGADQKVWAVAIIDTDTPTYTDTDQVIFNYLIQAN